MDDPKTQIAADLNKATNILVTVSNNPSVDQLAGAVGLTLLLNKLGKHATAVFSGQVPSTLEFLQAEQTLEKNTDSLRDFIIALDKSKADKLRYKVEDQMVKIFITPYRTSLSDKDLEFSQGDFNVEVVMALGVNQQQDLDQAITTHGRILHDATVVSVNTQSGASLGSINWVDAGASSLCEMLVDLGLNLKADVLDSQMATAFLTGIVANTNRFSNEKTSSRTMEMSAKLMAAGANQQLVATQLQTGSVQTPPTPPPSAPSAELPEIKPPAPQLVQEEKPSDGALEINHGEAPAETQAETPPEEDKLEQIHIDDDGQLKPAAEANIKQKVIEPLPVAEETPPSRPVITEPPKLGGKLTANSTPEALDPSVDPLSAAPATPSPLLSHSPSKPDDLSVAMPPLTTSPPFTPAVEDIIGKTSSNDDTSLSPPPPVPPLSPPSVPSEVAANDQTNLPVSESPLPSLSPLPPSPPVGDLTPPAIDNPTTTLTDLEKEVESPHLDQPNAQTSAGSANTDDAADLNAARDAVMQAVSGSTPQILEPIQSLNAAPMDLNLGDMPAVATSPASAFNDTTLMSPTPLAPSPAPMPGLNLTDPGMPADNTAASVTNPTPPPPVPPPMMPPAAQGMTHGQQQLPNAEDENAPPTNPQIF